MIPARTTNALIGSPIERLEDMRFLRGRGQYVDDLAFDAMLHAVILRSPVAHGRIRAIDKSAALRLPAIHGVITAAELGASIPVIPLRQDGSDELMPFLQPVIADRMVRYVGEPIAVVLADSPARGEDALEHVAVEIEAVAAVVDATMAAAGESLLFEQAGSNLALTLTGLRGDCAAAFGKAAYTRRKRFKVQR